MRYLGRLVVAVIWFMALSIVHELGHYVAYTVLHWNLAGAGYVAAIVMTPYGLACSYPRILGLFAPAVHIAGLLATLPFLHFVPYVKPEVQAVIIGMVLYGLLESIMYFIGNPLGGMI